MIAIDFDGVIAYHEGIERPHNLTNVPPVEDARDALHWIVANGYKPYVLTARPPDEHPQIKQWLSMNGFPNLEVTNVKKFETTLLIDDRAFRFTNWQDVCKYLG